MNQLEMEATINGEWRKAQENWCEAITVESL